MTQTVGVAFRFEEGIVHKILELDSSRQGFSNTVRAESSTGPSEEQSLIQVPVASRVNWRTSRNPSG